MDKIFFWFYFCILFFLFKRIDRFGKLLFNKFSQERIVPALRIMVVRENGLAFFLATGET